MRAELLSESKRSVSSAVRSYDQYTFIKPRGKSSNLACPVRWQTYLMGYTPAMPTGGKRPFDSAQGKKPKKYVHHHKDGTVWAKGATLGGKMHGAWVWFRKDGSRMRSGNFDNNKQVGTWITYDKKGKVMKKTLMDSPR